MKLGSKNINSVYLGDKKITSVKLGDVELLSESINGSPYGLTVVVNSLTQMTLSWDSSATNQDGTYIYGSTNLGVTYSLFDTLIGTGKSKQVSGLTPVTRYDFKIVHYKKSKLSDYSNVVHDGTVIGLDNWKTAIRNLDSGSNSTYDINFVGDSITEGRQSALDATVENLGFVGQVRTFLQNRYSNVGLGCKPQYYNYIGLSITFTGTWTNTAAGFNNISKVTSTLNNTASFSFTGTDLYLISLVGPQAGIYGQFTVSIDGGGAVTFTNITASTAIRDLLIASGLTDTSHTCVITNSSGKTLTICGFHAVSGTKGVRCNNLGKSGYTSTNGVAGGATVGSLPAAKLLNPKLTVCSFITNDIQLVTVETFTSNTQAIIDSAKQTGDIILVAANGRTDKTAAQQDPFVNALISLASTNNCMLVNIYADWAINGEALGYITSDKIHPTLNGHTYIANAILKYIINSWV